MPEANRWAEFATFSDAGLRREVFFIESAGTVLHGSIYAASPLRRPVGVMLCNSWGFEGDQCSRLAHPLALAVAGAGGAAAVFHYPGFGDSQGELDGTTIDTLADAAVDAFGEFSLRLAGLEWVLGGLMFGASVACLAADRGVEAGHLFLVQPSLRPSRYFARLERASRRSIEEFQPSSGFAYGYPLPPTMLESAASADSVVEASLERFAGDGTVVRHSRPAPLDELPARFEQICAPGSWRFGARDLSDLRVAGARRLRELTEAAA